MGNQNKGAIQGQKNPSVNPQGHGKDVEFSTEPKSELENRAKKSNTKI
ncbi:small, acid-soluble spore protein L [Priestia abyssalis]|nr:small, acid-soluble spore protein L [Priestia abyssalis]